MEIFSTYVPIPTPTTGGEAARGDERSVMWRGDEGMREGSEDSKIHLPALTHYLFSTQTRDYYYYHHKTTTQHNQS